MSKSLKTEIVYDGFENMELARKNGWYKKMFYCSNCDFLIRVELWENHYMFGLSTPLKDNQTPNYCPNCGTRTDY